MAAPAENSGTKIIRANSRSRSDGLHPNTFGTSLVHRVPVLWRFHAVHHVDLDLDASTALRFHFGEMAISVPYRAAQVVLLGIGPSALALWQAFLSLSILITIRLEYGSSLADVQSLGSRTKPDKTWAAVHDNHF